MATKGDWKSSQLYQKMTLRTTEKKHGARVWLTKTQLTKKYGCEELAQQIVDSKCADPETYESQTKPHPDAPDVEAGTVVGCSTCSTLRHLTWNIRLRCSNYVI